jgi:hypothetical protein
MQTSFNPPLVVVAVKADSHLAQVIERHQAFAIHLLTKQQKALAEAFTKPTTVGGGQDRRHRVQARAGDGGSAARRFQRVGGSEGDRRGALRRPLALRRASGRSGRERRQGAAAGAGRSRLELRRLIPLQKGETTRDEVPRG